MRKASATIAGEKKALRARMRAARRGVPDPDAAAQRAADLFLSHVPLPGEAAVAGYWPLESEIDCRPLLEALHGRGLRLALPDADEADRALVFRRWRPGDALAPGPHGTMHPAASGPDVEPGIVIVPLVAFDRAGRRLGQGEGYYDRTLRALRSRGPVLAAGLAFSVQEADRVPVGPLDEPLDWIVTDHAAWAVPRQE